MSWKITLKRYYFGKEREQFSLGEDTYSGWCMLAADSGRFNFSFAEDSQSEQTAEFGELVFCPPGQTFKRHALERISFHFAEFLVEGPWQLPSKVRMMDVGRLSSTFRYLQEWQDEDSSEQDTADAQHLLEDLLFMVHQERVKTERKPSSSLDPLMNRAAAFLESHALDHRLSLQELAGTLGIGASQLTRRFQVTFGMSPVRYLTRVRLSRARLLLIETTDTLDAIAEQCGFQNAFYFSRVFSQHMQISPSAYRRTFRV
ncbi:AraC family transcriptional regulator [Paenibacillus sp. HWE-109]|uniref:helix-turn-helix domain-containing protein n=1 Tax=Paenibacillus sp. HWE-109 TaxID=1306526 RepID=UPI001EDF7CD5|nr:AraC family transcriptional regulator [Paenibacillus sp. HWE-109]UKS30909.1 AraC family transcriptional regulator [Paenibacillus sp. HWE-109]